MRLYFQKGFNNFGDVLNPWLWSQLLPGLEDVGSDRIVFSGVGSLLNSRLPIGELNVVFGTGAGYGDVADAKEWKFYAVRGPKTAASLGLNEVAYGDPAILLPLVYPVERTEVSSVSFIPHYESSLLGGWHVPCANLGLNYIDPQSEFLSVIRSIASSRLVITESLHGAIVADAYRVPWIAVSMFHLHQFKWDDWAESLNVQYSHHIIDVVTSKKLKELDARALLRAQRFSERNSRTRGAMGSFWKTFNNLTSTILKQTVTDTPDSRMRRQKDLEQLLAKADANLSSVEMLSLRQNALLSQISVFKRDWQMDEAVSG